MYGLFVFVLPLDSDVVNAHRAEGIDECACQTGIGSQRNVQVDCGTADLVSVFQAR